MQTRRLIVLVTFLFAAGCGVNDRAVDDRTPSKGDGAPAEAQTCGTIAGLTCPTGYTCIDDDPDDGCDYDAEGGGADCSGTCQKKKDDPAPTPTPTPGTEGQPCGGFAGLQCADGFECVDDDPNDGCELGEDGGGADCSGVCQEQTTQPTPAGGVTVTTDKATYVVQEQGKATIDNQTSQMIFLAGCSQVAREQLVGGQWVDMGQMIFCYWEGLAVPVASGASFVATEGVTFEGPGTWRVSVTYGVGCQPDQPLSTAGCAETHTVYSDPVTVAAAQPAPTPTGGVLVTTDKTTYAAGEAGEATIDNQTAEALFLAGCSQVAREQLVGGQWVDRGQLVSCFWEGLAVPVASGASFDATEGVRFGGAGTWRVRVDYGVGCQPDQPLSSAGCTAMHAAYSDPVTVTAP